MAKPQSFEKEGSSAHYLGYVIGGLLTAGVTFSLLRMLLPLLRMFLPVLVGWWLWRRWQKARQNRQNALKDVFYQLIQEYQGKITVLDFAMTAKISAIAAREYLDEKAKEFSAHFEVTERGDVFYLFPTLKSFHFQAITQLPTIDNLPECEPEHAIVSTSSLTQAQLARRLGVSAGAISRKKHGPDLADWTKGRDPDGIAWAYLVQTQRFFPADGSR